MAFVNGPLEAIKIIESVEKEKEDKQEHVIKLIRHHANGPSLQDILCREFKNKPIFVFSVCGKTRGGKSFLLNMMTKYLDSQGNENWTSGDIPTVFEWKGGKESITKGIWICPKIYKRKTKNGVEVGVLLMDNQGLFDGDQTDGESVAISGISTSLSFCQMFNLKEKICTNDLESIWRHLVSENSDHPEDCSTTRLMFIVRDYADEDEGCGLDHGTQYIEAEKNRGTSEVKKMWQSLQKTFPVMHCLLLPLPGYKVMRGKAKQFNDVEITFLDEVKKFFDEIFSPENLTKDTLRGQELFVSLEKFDGQVADDSLSFINVFTEHGNSNKLDSLIHMFESRIKSIENNPVKGKSLMNDILSAAKKKFKGKTANNHLLRLEEVLIERINLLVKKWILKRYKSSLRSQNELASHAMEWHSVNQNLSYFVGTDKDNSSLKDEVIMDCAKHYYEKLRENVQQKFVDNCQHKDLDQLKGFDEIFVSKEFIKNKDFQRRSSASSACDAIWLEQREHLRFYVQDVLLACVAALTEVDKEWLQKVTQIQFKYFEIFTWNECHFVKVDDNVSLKELIGYTMYKKNQNLREYSSDENEKIECIAAALETESCPFPIKMTCIFIIYCEDKKDFYDPLYKVHTSSGHRLVDTKGRVYKDWTSFVEDNKLPDCLYCHPSEGEYNKSKGFQVAFTWSPASTFGEKLLKVLDVVGKVVAVGSAGLLATATVIPGMALFATGAVAAATAGGYGVVRSIGKLVDKVTHKESVKAGDVVDVVANGLSIASGGITGAVVLTTIGKELACAPAIIQGIATLTNLAFQLGSDDVNYLSLANELTLFLIFNSKSLDGAIENIRQSYKLPEQTSNLNILKDFISKNCINFPVNGGSRPDTEQYFSEGLRSLMLTAIMNKAEERPLTFIKDLPAAAGELRPLNNAISGSHNKQEQLEFFAELINLVSNLIQMKSNSVRLESYRGMEYHPVREVMREVDLAGVCSGLCHIAECSDDESVKKFCSVVEGVLKLICERTGTTNLHDLTYYLHRNKDEIARRMKGIV